MLTATTRKKLEYLRDAAASIKEAKYRIRVCSLCKTYKNPLMWAHYAGGFNGVAIKLQISDPWPVKVTYGNYLPKMTETQVNKATDSPESIERTARDILSRKLKVWSDEEEVRILHREEFYKDIDPKKVIVGPRVHEHVRKALEIVCAHKGIELQLAKISKGRVTAAGFP